MFGRLGVGELIIILIIILLIFGAKRLPEIGKSLGLGISSFKKTVQAEEDDKNKNENEKQDQ